MFSKNLWKKTSLYFVAISTLTSLCACAPKQSIVMDDILTQKKTESGKTQITVLVKHAFSIHAFEKAVEEKFPDIDIIQVGNYTTAMSPNEYVARLINDDLTDIVMTWPLSFGEEYWEERLLDLSALSFTTRYNVSMLDSISKDGKLYYLPGPAQVRGIVYNKTLFEENGWEVPTTYDEFLTLCQTIEATGIRSIQLGFKNSEVLDTAFVGYSYANSFSKPKDSLWIESYSQGNGKFLDQFQGALETFKQMVDLGIWKEEDLNFDYSDREKSFFNRQAAMIEDSTVMTYMGPMAGNTDEFALMPFFNPGGEGNDWARLYMVCYIGMNKHLAEPQNKKKYEQVIKIMDYISTPEGQAALAADTGTMYSSLKGVEAPNLPETKEVLVALEHGRFAIFPEIPRVQTALREGLEGLLRQTMTIEEVGDYIDKANAEYGNNEKPEIVLGTATENFTIVETGNFITDAMSAYTDSDIALFLDGGKDGRYNNKGVTAKLYAGDILQSDLVRVMPDFKYGEKGECWKIKMKGADLIHTLEYSIPIDNNTGWFYYFSGMIMEFDPTADPGKRIIQVKLSDGTAIDPDKIYTLAVSENSVDEAFIIECEKTGTYIQDILVKTIQEKKSITPSHDGRFTTPKQ